MWSATAMSVLPSPSRCPCRNCKGVIMHRKLHSFLAANLVYLAVVLAGLVLLVLGLVLGQQAWRSQRQLDRVEHHVSAVDSLLQAVDAQARERGLIAAMLGGADGVGGGLVDPENLQVEVGQRWQAARAAIDAVLEHVSADSPIHARSDAVWDALQGLNATRSRLFDPAGTAVTLTEWFGATTRVNRAAQALQAELMLQADWSQEVARLQLMVVQSAMRAVEHAGQVRGLLGYYVASGQPVPEQKLRMARFSYDVARLNRSELEAFAADLVAYPAIAASLAAWKEKGGQLDRIVQAVFEGAETGRYPISAFEWYRQTSECIELLFRVARAASSEAVGQLDDQARRHSAFVTLYAILALAAVSAAGLSLRKVRDQAIDVFLHKELAETILDSVADAVVAIDAEGRILYLNPIAEDLTGWPHEAAWGRCHDEVIRICNKLHTSQSDPLGLCLAQGVVVVLAEGHVLVRRDGEEVAIEDSCAPITGPDGGVAGAVMIFTSKERMQTANRILTYHATHDALTDLGNRRLFENEANELVRHAGEAGRTHTLAFIDLDNFRVVNDIGGHAAGDQMLRQVAFLIRQHIRETDVAARLGGDEFGLLLKNCSAGQARRVAKKLIEAVRDFRFPWNGHTFSTGMSIGLVEITPDGPVLDQLFQDADAACYAAKEQGRNHVRIYHPGDDRITEKTGHMKWIPRLHRALEENAFDLCCHEIRPLSPEQPPRVELLVRLRGEGGRLVLPGAFIPAAERHGLMPEVDRKVIGQACRRLAPVVRQHKDLRFHVNLSGATLSDPEIADFIVETASSCGIAPKHLCFEITETAAIASLDLAIAIMSRLTRNGFAFVLDDFGAGLSSFNYLKQLPVEMVKIDGAFVRRLTEDSVSVAMVEAIVSIARLMGMRTCAEFVENAETLEMLGKLGVDYAQGFHFGQPRPLAECPLITRSAIG